MEKKQTSLRVNRSTYEKLKEIKEDQYEAMPSIDYYDMVLLMGIESLKEADEKHEDATADADEKQADEVPEKPVWITRDNSDPVYIRDYCKKHPGAREEFMTWIRATKKPETIREWEEILA